MASPFWFYFILIAGLFVAAVKTYHDARIGSQREGRRPRQLFPVYSFGGQPNSFSAADVRDLPDEVTNWEDLWEYKDVEIDWGSVDDDVEVYAQLAVDVCDREFGPKVDSKYGGGGGIVRVWNVTDGVVAVTSGKYERSETPHKVALRIPRSASPKHYRLQKQMHGFNAMMSVVGDAVFKRKA